MHFLGFAIVPEPTDEAVDAAMAPHQEGYEPAPDGDEDGGRSFGHWDWYRVGGRWDGYLVSDEEMKARETDNGFNFQPENEQVDRNAVRVSEVPADRRSVYFFVADGEWVAHETWDSEAPSSWDKNGKGAHVEVPDFADRLDAALTAHPDHFVVVIDAHN